MKMAKRFCSMLAVFCLIFTTALPAMAAEDEYTYTVRIFAGKQGTINGSEVMEYTGLHYGERVTFSPQSQVSLNNDSKYYVRGIRESGKDNAESVGTASFVVTGDADYVVSYGILGSAVQYQIRYVDVNGRELAPSETYYGNVGDSPVIAFRYIEGYQPQAYNLTGALLEDAAQNVYTFTYRAVEAAPATQPTTQAAETTAAEQGNEGGEQGNEENQPGNEGNEPGNEGNQPGNEGNQPGNEGNQPGNEGGEQGTEGGEQETQEIVDIRETEAPLANQQLPGTEVTGNGDAWPTAMKAAIALCGAIVGCAVLYLIIRLKKKGTK